MGVEREYRRTGTLADDYGQPVVQLLDRDSFFERSQILRYGYGGQR
jgi:hypothetical protein